MLLSYEFLGNGNQSTYREDEQQHRNGLLMFLCRPFKDPRYGSASADQQHECASPAKACIQMIQNWEPDRQKLTDDRVAGTGSFGVARQKEGNKVEADGWPPGLG
jgi:hypothetical protein